MKTLINDIKNLFFCKHNFGYVHKNQEDEWDFLIGIPERRRCKKCGHTRIFRSY